MKDEQSPTPLEQLVDAIITLKTMSEAVRKACRQRNQACDALADLLLALDNPIHRAVLRYTPALVSAIQQARTVLPGGGRDGNAGD